MIEPVNYCMKCLSPLPTPQPKLPTPDYTIQTLHIEIERQFYRVYRESIHIAKQKHKKHKSYFMSKLEVSR